MTRFRIVLALLTLVPVSAARAAPADFTVSSGDATFRLADARGKLVALHFLLRTECPYCQKYVAEIARRGPEIAGMVHVFMKPDSEAEIQEWSQKLRDSGIAATIYRDADARLADEFNVPNGYEFHGQTVHFPALILLGPDGNEVFRHVGKDNTDRFPFEPLARKAAELSKNPSADQYNLSDGRLMLQGYDPVAYFESGKAEAGTPELVSQYRGVTYRFANPERRMKFAASPEMYAPAYGGWCATAMADGRKVEIDPANFRITNGRLFLFYKGWLGNALNDWKKDEKNLTVKADDQWRKIAPADAEGSK